MSELSNNQESHIHQLLHQLLHDPNIPNLTDNQPDEIFPEAEDIPDALNHNLVTPDRTIKLIRNDGGGVAGLLRGFYYQLLKLCFQLQDEQNSKNYLQITKSIVFDQSILQNSELRIYARRVAEFINTMQSQSDIFFQEILNQYHQIDESLINLLHSLLSNRSGIKESINQVEDILNELCEFFEVTLIPNHPFYQFEEADTYLYYVNEEEIYIIFDDTVGTSQSSQISNSQNLSQKESKLSQKELKSNQSNHSGPSERSKPSEKSQKYALPEQTQKSHRSNYSHQQEKSQGSYRSNKSQRNQYEQQYGSGYAQAERDLTNYRDKSSSYKLKGQSVQSESIASPNRPFSNKSANSQLSQQHSTPIHGYVGDSSQSKTWYEAPLPVSTKVQNTFRSLQGPSINESTTVQNFKKGIIKTSGFYEVTTQQLQRKKVSIAEAERPTFNYYSPTNDIPTKPTTDSNGLRESHFANSSQYYENYYGQLPHNNSIHSNVSRNDTLMNLFGDMLKSGKHQASFSQTNTKRQIENTEKILQAHEDLQKPSDSDLYPNFMKKINKMEKVDIIDRAKSVNSINDYNSSDLQSSSIVNSKNLDYSATDKKRKPSMGSSQSEKIQRKNYSTLLEGKTESYMAIPQRNIQEKQSEKKEMHAISFDEEDSIFYKPKKSQLKVIAEVAASKESVSGFRNTIDKNEDSKGSVYRQFSDTRILKLLKEPHRTKVQLMRNRFKKGS